MGPWRSIIPIKMKLDKRVIQFSQENRASWRSLNVPFEDGKVLYDIILKNNYRSALEIGT